MGIRRKRDPSQMEEEGQRQKELSVMRDLSLPPPRLWPEQLCFLVLEIRVKEVWFQVRGTIGDHAGAPEEAVSRRWQSLRPPKMPIPP